MTEYGIMMRDEMVRALLRPPGDPLRKTVTRRTSGVWAKRKPGDLLWVRECWASGGIASPEVAAEYRATCPESIRPLIRWRSSMVMPRRHSRLTLRVADVRREQCAASEVTHRWVGNSRPGWLYGSPTRPDRVLIPVANYELAPHPFEPLPWVDDAEARREGVEDRAAYLRLWEEINGQEYPKFLFRIEFEEVACG